MSDWTIANGSGDQWEITVAQIQDNSHVVYAPKEKNWHKTEHIKMLPHV